MSEPQIVTADGRLVYRACDADPVFSSRYDLSTWRELGSGASAVVAAIHCRSLGETVAVKVFVRTAEADRRRMSRELRNVHRLRAAPTIVHTYAALDGHLPGAPEDNPGGGLFWIEQEYVDGSNLGAWIAERTAEPLPFAAAAAATTELRLQIACDAADAVAVAAEAGIVHRDIKPENFLVPAQPPPHLKLADFGMSKSRVRPASDTAGWTGTDLYRAPEVWSEETVTSAADVYALALVLFRLLSNNAFPWPIPQDLSPHQFCRLHTQERPDHLRDHNPHAPPELDALIVRCLAKRPDQRPAAGEVADYLHRLRALHCAPPASAPEPAPRPAAAAAAVGLVVLLGFAWWLAGPRRPTQLAPGPSTTLAQLAPPALKPTTAPPAVTTPEVAPSPAAAAPPRVASPTAAPTPNVPPSPRVAVTASAAPTPTVSPRTSPKPRPDVTVALQPGGGVAVTASAPITDVVVTLINGSARHTCRVGDVDPAWASLLPRDACQPEPAADFVPSVIEVAGRAADGTPVRRSVSVPRAVR